jgi:hypothetical protein
MHVCGEEQCKELELFGYLSTLRDTTHTHADHALDSHSEKDRDRD